MRACEVARTEVTSPFTRPQEAAISETPLTEGKLARVTVIRSPPNVETAPAGEISRTEGGVGGFMQYSIEHDSSAGGVNRSFSALTSMPPLDAQYVAKAHGEKNEYSYGPAIFDPSTVASVSLAVRDDEIGATSRTVMVVSEAVSRPRKRLAPVIVLSSR